MKNRIPASALSLAINKTMFSYQNNEVLVKKEPDFDYTVKIANTIEERAAVFNLGYHIYLEKGFIGKNSKEWLIRNYDFNSETVILIVQDLQKNIAGSATLVFDDSTVLPAEKTFSGELKVLREAGNKISELSRLIINPKFRNSKEILVLLFNYSAIYIHHIKKYDGLAVQVNPRHKKYYKALLDFEELGIEKACPQVKNAPANLLYLSATKYQSAIKRYGSEQAILRKDKSLYQYFLNAEQESLVAYYLTKQFKPMTQIEKIHFGFSESGKEKAIGL